jgi:hypothetical protein
MTLVMSAALEQADEQSSLFGLSTNNTRWQILSTSAGRAKW